jgi:hypothetical protein
MILYDSVFSAGFDYTSNVFGQIIGELNFVFMGKSQRDLVDSNMAKSLSFAWIKNFYHETLSVIGYVMFVDELNNLLTNIT